MCIYHVANSTVEAMVEVQNDNSSAPPVLISPHNGTTLTTITSHPSQHTLSCSVQPPYNSHFWVYNGEIVPELSGEVVNVSSVGVYQCFAGNNFGFSVATVRLVPAGIIWMKTTCMIYQERDDVCMYVHVCTC